MANSNEVVRHGRSRKTPVVDARFVPFAADTLDPRLQHTRESHLAELGLDPDIMSRRQHSDAFHSLYRQEKGRLRRERSRISRANPFGLSADKFEAETYANFLINGALTSQSSMWQDRADLLAPTGSVISNVHLFFKSDIRTFIKHEAKAAGRVVRERMVNPVGRAVKDMVLQPAYEIVVPEETRDYVANRMKKMGNLPRRAAVNLQTRSEIRSRSPKKDRAALKLGIGGVVLLGLGVYLYTRLTKDTIFPVKDVVSNFTANLARGK